MGKISDFFSITKRERIGTLVALLLLAGAIAFASFSKSWRAQSQAMAKPNQAVMQYLTDSVTVKPDSTSSHKKAKKAKHSPRKKKKQQEKMQNRDTSGMDDPDILITKLELCEKIALVDPHRCQDELRLLLEKVKEWKDGSTEER